MLIPVRGGIVKTPGDWPRRRVRAKAGAAPPPYTDARWINFRLFGRCRKEEVIESTFRQRIYFEDELFVRVLAHKFSGTDADQTTIPFAPLRAPESSSSDIAKGHVDRNEAIVAANATGA